MKSSKTSKPLYAARGKPKILQIGAGRWGMAHARIWIEMLKQGRIGRLSVVEKNESSRKKLKKIYGIDAAAKLSSGMLREADGIDIVTPPSAHFALAKRCLKYAPVFVEKPLTLSSKSSIALFDAAKRAGRPLFAGHIYRFHPVLREIKSMTRALGNPVSIHCQFHDRPEVLPKDCGILFSDLHPIDILDYLMEDLPSRLMAEAAGNGDGFETSVGVLLSYGMTSATIQLSWLAKPKTRLLTVIFSDRAVIADLAANTLTVISGTGRSVKKYAGARPLSDELAAFVGIAEGKNVEYPNAEVGARVIRVVELANKSLRLGRSVIMKL